MHFQGLDGEAADMFDVLVVGSVNRDTGLTLARLPRTGETLACTDLHESGGGKGANQALAARQFGSRVALLAAVGRDGDLAMEDLADAGVDLGAVVRLPDALTGRAVLLVTDDDNAIVVHPGANALLTAAHVTEHAGSGPAPRVVALQHEIPEAAVAAAVRAYRGRALVLLNPSPFRPIDAEIRAGVDVLVVNRGELSDLLGRELPDDLVQLLADAPLGDTVVTLGPDGALVRVDGRVEHVPAVDVDAVDTVGAGDAFLGALASLLATGADLAATVRDAVAAAALAVTVPGARNPHLTPAAAAALQHS